MYDIKSAAKEGKFTLYYQPKIDLKEKKVKSAEALIRLKIDDKIIPPIKFIPEAEKNGDIKEIDKWVFKRLPEDLRYVKIKSQENPTVSFNVSASHFTDQDIVESIKDIVERARDFYPKLEIEITETALIKDKKKASNAVNHLKEMGYRFALDDFGAGYASLVYLKEFPIDTLKIDKSFVDDMLKDKKSMAIVDGIMYLSKKLELDTVAEGVENIEQVKILYQEGVKEIQGYYYSKPLPLDDFIFFLNAINKTKKENQFINWTDDYLLGDFAIDSQHMIIFNMVNSLYDILRYKQKRKNTPFKQYLEIVDIYINDYLKSEEEHMKKLKYPYIYDHFEEHKKIKEKYYALKDNLSDVNERDIFNLFVILKEYWLIHILVADKKMVEFFKKEQK